MRALVKLAFISIFAMAGAVAHAGVITAEPVLLAPSAVKEFKATSAVSDAHYRANVPHDHSAWLPFLEQLNGSPTKNNRDGSDLDFLPGVLFTLNADGTATLSGRVASQADPRFAFDVSFDLAQRQGPGWGGPKKELHSSAYSNRGGPIDPGTWEYFDLTGGIFTGVGRFAGIELVATQRPQNGRYPAQIGYGANNKNANYGLSFWFSLAVTQNCKVSFCRQLATFQQNNRLFGDINIDLMETPLPAGVWLFGSGLAGLAALRRRRRKV
ncbi:MAG: VPLPA-CTERM sorting domain-containing protein [Pseudomonadota bacterium]